MLTFPLPLNADVVSQPPHAWNTGNARALDSPILAQMALMLWNLKFLPVPKATQMSADG